MSARVPMYIAPLTICAAVISSSARLTTMCVLFSSSAMNDSSGLEGVIG